MKVIGQGRVTLTQVKDEYPHIPDNHPDWQESVVLQVWDAEQKCYCFFRIGHEPNQGQNGSGSLVVFSNIWVPGQYYRYCAGLPLRDEDRFANGACGGPKLRYEYDGKHHWIVSDGDVSAHLVMEDYLPAFDFFPSDHNLGEVAPHHIEAVGYVSGTIEFKGRTFQIKKALGHRDRSWGIRKWESIRGHRWGPAMFGEDFMTHALAMQAPDGTLTQFGYVYREGTFYVPNKVTIACHVEADGLSTRGGVVNFTMDSGENIEVVYKNQAPGSLSFHRGYPCNDAPASVTCGSRIGSGVLEYANKATGGSEQPKQSALVGSYVDNGIFSYRTGSSFI